MKFTILDLRFAIAEKTDRKSKIENRKSLHSDAIVRESHPLTLLRSFLKKLHLKRFRF